MGGLTNETGIFPAKVTVNDKNICYEKDFQEGFDAFLSCNDTLEFVRNVPKHTVNLVVSSPHYNIGKPFEQRMDFDEYLKWQKEVATQCVELLTPQGSLCWEIGTHVRAGESFPLDIFFYGIFKDLGLKLRNRIVWHYEHGLHSSNKFSGRYETILWFTKGEEYIFNLDPVRIPQKYPGKRAYKGPKKGEPTGNPLGKNPSDVWKVICEDWKKGIWDIPNVKSNHMEKTIHPAQFPIELVERLLLALTNEGDLIFDPFVGVGTSLISALLNNRRSLGVDKERKYTDIAYQRIISALEGTLKRRPLGKPIMIPKGNEKVAKIPPEWQESNASSLRHNMD